MALILIVLLQTGKGASMGAAFGGSSQTIFGSSGAATFLTKLTTVAAAVFMITSLLLAFMHGPGSSTSVVRTPSEASQKQAMPTKIPTGSPATPSPAAPPVPVSPANPVSK